jgi:ribosomal protein L40E
MRDHHIPVQHCLKCGYRMDMSSDMDQGHQPRPGDVSICMRCAALHVFDDNLIGRAPTGDEMIKLVQNRKVLQLQLAISQLKFPNEKTKD